MTTIATDGKSMAGDGQSSVKGTIVATDSVKVRRLPDGRIFGACGNNESSEAAFQWLANGGDKPKLSEDFGALVVELDGRIALYADELIADYTTMPVAFGSGMDFAIGAMMAGATPAEAVSIACQRDPNSGGKITVEHLT